MRRTINGMNKNLCNRSMALAYVLALAGCTGTSDLAGVGGTRIPVPTIRGEYVRIYKPATDVFPGPNAGGLEAGREYDEWVVNDHCFVRHRGRWHAFGITHPLTALEHVHAGEYQSFHALAPVGAFRDVLEAAAWTDQAKVLPASERPGEIPENHAPFVLRKDGAFLMIYGPSPLRLATSEDLFRWTPRGKLRRDPGGRDPHVFYWDGVYYLLVCGRAEVRMTTSRDLESWEEVKVVLRMSDGIDPESPTLIRYQGTFYLFVCGWNGVWDRKDLNGAYQHVTYVYQSNDPFAFDASREICRLEAHAPEVFQDESGQWYISSAEWPNRGISVARLVWE